MVVRRSSAKLLLSASFPYFENCVVPIPPRSLHYERTATRVIARICNDSSFTWSPLKCVMAAQSSTDLQSLSY